MRTNLRYGHFVVAVSMLYVSSSMAVKGMEPDPVGDQQGTVRITVSSPKASTPEEPEKGTQTAAPSAASNNNSEVLEDPWTKKTKTQQGLDELNEEAYILVAQRLNQGQIIISDDERKEKRGFFRQLFQSLEKIVARSFFNQALQNLDEYINSDGTVTPESEWDMRGTFKKYNLRLIEEYNNIRFKELKEKYSK